MAATEIATKIAVNFTENLTANITENSTVNITGNDTLLHDQTSSDLYKVPALLVVVLSVLYGSISVIAVAGNGLVIWAIVTSKRMRSVTNHYLANLAFADILIALFAIPFEFQAALLQRWNLPSFMCAFCPFIHVLSITVSVFTLTAIAVDRRQAILNPFSARTSKTQCLCVIALIWIAGLVLSSPMAYAQRVVFVSEDWPFCLNVNLPNNVMFVYRALLVVVQYLIPLSIMTWAYSGIGFALWGSSAPGNAQSQRDLNLMRNKKRVIKMLIIVVALFTLCWLPLQTYNILQHIFPQINEYPYINIIWFCFDWFAMSNSCYNPFIYSIYNEKFKQEFKMRLDFMAGKRRLTRDLSAFSSGRFEWRTNHVNTHERNLKHSSIVTNDTPLILTPDA
ncbi:tachykinin-like peptides receptor 99D [Melanaphis sacchari]|uniref:Tachykinin-like peptides receptor 99D n=1 Tax=Melanaphis sacchari TaxID=742174 RepID=A0A2H8TI41_9HEMI|nr:tachykinin-like peptides receptor 99D [Melanaphis sacchari]